MTENHDLKVVDELDHELDSIQDPTKFMETTPLESLMKKRKSQFSQYGEDVSKNEL